MVSTTGGRRGGRRKKKRQALIHPNSRSPASGGKYWYSSNSSLREFVSANSRHPGDACVKVGSGRKFASRQIAPNRAESGAFLDPSFIYTIYPPPGLVLAPESRLRRGLFCAPGPQKEPAPVVRSGRPDRGTVI